MVAGWCRGYRRFSGGFYLGLVLILVGGLGFVAAPRRTLADDGWAPPRTVFVPASGHTVDGKFLDAWRVAEPLVGNPITQEITAATGFGQHSAAKVRVQYYENVGLAALPDRGAGWRVQALPLGRGAMQRVAPRYLGAFARKGSCGGLGSDLCTSFLQTGHTLRFRFKSYWEANGGPQYVGLPLSEEFQVADGHTVQYFERAVLQWKAGEGVTPWALGRAEAQRLKLDTKAVAQAADIPTYSETLFVPPTLRLGVGGGGGFGPGPQRGARKEIVVSLSAQKLWAYQDGRLVMDTLVSTGREGFETPTGDFQILDKLPVHTMEGVLGGEYYNVPDVPDVMYFTDRGHALHGTYWHHNFGQVMSHGCVNLPLDVAAWMYGWAPVGTPVTILD